MFDTSVIFRFGEFAKAGAQIISGQESYVKRAENFAVDMDMFLKVKDVVKAIGVTKNFIEIIDFFDAPDGETPAGFQPVFELTGDGAMLADLKRNINYSKNGEKRPTGVLFSADCADPYEIRKFRNLIANVTTNPAIIYNTFINNEKANVGHLFNTREEVMTEIAKIVGPGVDISVELNNPFASENEILDEVKAFEEILSKYRLVVKVPHLGPITKENSAALLGGGAMPRYDQVETGSACRSHDLALMLHEHGYRTNFTLMAEPHQTAMALQARPSFINTFVRNRFHHNEKMENLLKCYEATGDESYLLALRTFMVETYNLGSADAEMSLFEVKRRAEWLLSYREWDKTGDGLDQARHNLRWLRHSNLPDTRLIICSLDGEMYSMVDKMLMEDEFADMTDRVIITASPSYLAGFTSSPAVMQYNKNFFKAAGTK